MAWPAVIESLFSALTSFVDTLMVSALGANAVAAVGLISQPRLMGLALFLALGVASSAVIARRYGEGRRDSANTTLLTTILFSSVAAVIVTLVFVFGADGIIRFCGSSESTHEMSVQYLKIVMGGISFQCMQMVINSSQRGAGNTRITMITNLIANSLNVVFNYLLIGGKFGFPALGVRGAAIATVLGYAVSFTISVASLFRKEQFLSVYYIIREKIRPSWEAFLSLCKFGYSIFIEQLLMRIGMSGDHGSENRRQFHGGPSGLYECADVFLCLRRWLAGSCGCADWQESGGKEPGTGKGIRQSLSNLRTDDIYRAGAGVFSGGRLDYGVVFPGADAYYKNWQIHYVGGNPNRVGTNPAGYLYG